MGVNWWLKGGKVMIDWLFGWWFVLLVVRLVGGLSGWWFVCLVVRLVGGPFGWWFVWLVVRLRERHKVEEEEDSSGVPRMTNFEEHSSRPSWPTDTSQTTLIE
jgi:hypothetical protein